MFTMRGIAMDALYLITKVPFSKSPLILVFIVFITHKEIHYHPPCEWWLCGGRIIVKQ